MRGGVDGTIVLVFSCGHICSLVIQPFPSDPLAFLVAAGVSGILSGLQASVQSTSAWRRLPVFARVHRSVRKLRNWLARQSEVQDVGELSAVVGVVPGAA